MGVGSMKQPRLFYTLGYILGQHTLTPGIFGGGLMCAATTAISGKPPT